METIEYKNKEFEVREIDFQGLGNVLISTTSLNELLLNEEGGYVSDEAIVIDEQIFYFVDENEIKLSEQELRKVLMSQVKC